MNIFVRAAGMACLSFGMMGCQTLMSHSQSDVIVRPGRMVHAKVSQTIYFGLSEVNLPVAEKLAKDCPAGILTGVETFLFTREFIIAKNYELVAHANCIDSK